QYKGGDLPDVAVRDLAIHPRDNDLVIATHGRGIWIIDDITPLRALTSETLGQDVAFLPTRPTVQRILARGGWAGGDAVFAGANPTGDAVITYYLKRRHIFGDMKIEVLDADGKVVGRVPTGKRRGVNRVAWSMRRKPPTVPAAATAAFEASLGPQLLPGDYTVRMTNDKQTYETKLDVVPDPRSTHTAEDRKAQYDLSVKLSDLLGEMSYTVDRINMVRLALDQRAAGLPGADPLGPELKKWSTS